MNAAWSLEGIMNSPLAKTLLVLLGVYFYSIERNRINLRDATKRAIYACSWGYLLVSYSHYVEMTNKNPFVHWVGLICMWLIFLGVKNLSPSILFKGFYRMENTFDESHYNILRAKIESLGLGGNIGFKDIFLGYEQRGWAEPVHLSGFGVKTLILNATLIQSMSIEQVMVLVALKMGAQKCYIPIIRMVKNMVATLICFGAASGFYFLSPQQDIFTVCLGYFIIQYVVQRAIRYLNQMVGKKLLGPAVLRADAFAVRMGYREELKLYLAQSHAEMINKGEEPSSDAFRSSFQDIVPDFEQRWIALQT